MLSATADTPVAGTPATPTAVSAIEHPAASGAAVLVPRPVLVSSRRAGATGWNRAAATGWTPVTGGTTRPSHAVGTKNQFDRRPNVDWKLSPVTLTVLTVPT